MQLDGYSELTRINMGGMAAIYRGRQDSLNRTVAIKYLAAEFLWDAQIQSLFEQESRVIAQLSHPNIVQIIDRGISKKGRPYFVMELINGMELTEYLESHRPSLSNVIELMIQICKGLAFAHKNGVVHRDIKPSNVLIDAEQHAKILDFGIAQLSLECAGAQTVCIGDSVVGTPDYMSPEQLNTPDKVDARSDLYSLGALMFRALTGSTHVALYPQWRGALATLPKALSKLVVQCLENDATARPASADEVRFRLLQILSGAHLGQTQKRDAAELLGSKLENFQLLDVLGQNKHGASFLFDDKRRERPMVIKKRKKTRDGYNTAKTLQTLSHPSIVRILGVSKNQTTFIVAMPHYKGGNLAERLSRAFSLPAFFTLARSICEAIEFAHSHGVLHGNLHPNNILFDKNGAVFVSDFGFDTRFSNKLARDYQLNEEGSPSLVRDLFSVGAIFFHCLTGEPPQRVSGRLRINDAFTALDNKTQLFLRDLLEPGAYTRFASFSDVLDSLKNLQKDVENTPIITRRSRTTPALATISALAALVSYLAYNANVSSRVAELVPTVWTTLKTYVAF
ncbi:MAG: protein kinase [Pseudomonadota bacterium]